MATKRASYFFVDSNSSNNYNTTKRTKGNRERTMQKAKSPSTPLNLAIPILAILVLILSLVFVQSPTITGAGTFESITGPSIIEEPIIVNETEEITEPEEPIKEAPPETFEEIDKPIIIEEAVIEEIIEEEILELPFGPVYAPTHNQPLLTSSSGNDLTTDNLTCYNQSTAQTHSNIYNWYKNDKPIMVINMPFDSEVSGNNEDIADYSGFSYNGTLGNATANTGPVWTSAGKVGGAYQFVTSQDFINLSEHADELDLSTGSLEFWFKANDSSIGTSSDFIFGAGDETTEGVGVALGHATGDFGDESLSYYITKGGTGYISAHIRHGHAYYADNTWHHFVLVVGSNFNKFYIDGAQETASYRSGKGSSSTGNYFLNVNNLDAIGIGQRYYPGYPNQYIGLVDEFRIWNISLSTTQVLQRYLDTKDGYSDNSTIVSAETGAAGETWICEVTPNNATADGTTKNSTVLTIDAAPNVTLISPATGKSDYDGNVTFNCTATDNLQLSNLTLYVWNSSNEEYNVSIGYVSEVYNETVWDLISIPEDTFEWSCLAFDNSTLSAWATSNNTLTILYNAQPTHNQPILNSSSGNNVTIDNLTCYNQSTADADDDVVTNIYNWYKNDAPLMALYYPFDADDSGGVNTTKDYSSQGNNGTLGGSEDADVLEPTFRSTGKIGGAYYFNGSQYINAGTSSSLGSTTSLTIEFWFNVTDLSTNTHRMVMERNLNYYVSLWNETGGMMVGLQDGGSGYHNQWISGPLTENTWYHAVIVISNTDSASRGKIYINGTDSTINYHYDGGWNDDGSAGLGIGMRPDWSSFPFPGELDEIRIYPGYEMSENQILQRYLDTKAGFSNSSTIVSDEISAGDNWTCELTPNDGMFDGLVKNSSSLLIISTSAPDQPTLINPQSNTTGISLNPVLNVTVTDVDGDNVDVSFLGRKYNESNDNFTIIVLPDTQKFTQHHVYNRFDNQTRWITENIADLSIKFVMHEGDIVQTASNRTMWDDANISMSLLDGKIPYSVLPGNHDFNPDGGAGRNTTYYNEFFNYTRYENETWYGGHMGTDYDNNYHYFNSSGMQFMVINLEFCPTDAILAWANSTVGNNSDKRVIVVTHVYMQADDTRLDVGEQTACSFYACGGNEGEDVWEEFVRFHDNIFLVLSGHYWVVGHDGTGTLTSTGLNGNSVHQLLYNNQNDPGHAYLRIMTFDPTYGLIHVRTYTPYHDNYSVGDDNFALSYAMNAATNFTVVGGNTSIANGTSIDQTWSNLENNTQYEWCVNISDIMYTTVSSIWNFTTTAAPTHTQPFLNISSENNLTTDNLTCYNQSTADADDDVVTNIYNWYKNDSPIMSLYYPFDNQNSGGVNTTKDYSGNENHGQLGNITDEDALEPTWRSTGQVGGAYYFNGSQYIDAGNDTSLSSTTNLTIEFWFNVTDLSTNTHRMVVERNKNYYVSLWNETGGIMVGLQDSLSDYHNQWISGPLTENTWYHAVIVINETNSSNRGKIYINGTDSTIDYHYDGGWNDDGTTGLGIGIRPTSWTTFPFPGELDEIRIYVNYTMSANQVMQRYLDTKAGFSNSSTIVSDETGAAVETWICEVTPSDGETAGNTINSSNITIIELPPVIPIVTGRDSDGISSTFAKKQFYEVTPAGVTFILTKPLIDVDQVYISTKEKVNNVVVGVGHVNENKVPKVAPPEVYKYLQITAGDLSNENIALAEIKFRVEKDWLDTRDQDSIFLYRYTDSWERLPTEKEKISEAFVHYSSETPGFSYFAVVSISDKVNETSLDEFNQMMDELAEKILEDMFVKDGEGIQFRLIKSVKSMLTELITSLSLVIILLIVLLLVLRVQIASMREYIRVRKQKKKHKKTRKRKKKRKRRRRK